MNSITNRPDPNAAFPGDYTYYDDVDGECYDAKSGLFPIFQVSLS